MVDDIKVLRLTYYLALQNLILETKYVKDSCVGIEFCHMGHKWLLEQVYKCII